MKVVDEFEAAIDQDVANATKAAFEVLLGRLNECEKRGLKVDVEVDKTTYMNCGQPQGTAFTGFLEIFRPL